MDLKKALEILEIATDDYKHINYQFLKKKYHKLALLYHPDKNKSPEANIKFQELQNAYHFLLKETDFLKEEKFPYEKTEFTYDDSLYIFLQTIFKNNNIIDDIIQIITTGSVDISLKLIHQLDKETTIHIYSFLEKYKTTLYISSELIERIKKIVIDKYQNVTIYKLNPTLKDLFENNIFQLKIGDSHVHVPLWHHEMYYDLSGNEIIVICEPYLQSEIEIDEENNIIYTKKINKKEFMELIDKKYLEIEIYNKILEIPVRDLYLRETQNYIFRNKGISVVNEDIYEINEKSNVIIKIIIY